MSPSLLCSVASLMALLAAPAQLEQTVPKNHPFMNRRLPAEERITNLISLMNLKEKLGCLGRADLTRLGVRWVPSVEGLHGLAQDGPANWLPKKRVPTTIFPQSYGLGATWDPGLIEEVGRIEGYECRWIWQNKELKQGAILAFTPNADLGRDPRWGRTEECFGEDPCLVGELSAAFVRGIQSEKKGYWQCASLMKHFLANSNEDTRETSSSNFDARQFREYYSVGFRRGFEAGSRAYMTAYNAYNGIPCTIHPFIKNVTVKDWGMDGIVCTDGGAYRLLMTAHKHTDDPGVAAADCIKAGITRFLDDYMKGVESALERGLITEADLEEPIRKNLRVQLKLGALDGPKTSDPYAKIGEGDAPWLSDSHKAAALLATQKSIVLLKNEAATLPLNREKVKKIAVIGQRAGEVLLDWYSGKSAYAITPLKGIKAKVGSKVRVSYSQGGPEAIQLAKDADVAIVVVGNHPIGGEKQGWAKVEKDSYGREAVDRKSLVLEDEDLVKEVFSANPRTILVLQSSFPYAINWSQAHLPAILHLTHCSQETGTALADVLFGDFNPGGRLTQTWPRSLKDLPDLLDYDLRNGHTYLYSKADPLYPFGFGLSYSAFEYRRLEGPSEVGKDGMISLSVTVANKSERDGDEVVQAYVSLPDSKVYRPIKQLKAFKRLTIKGGGRAKVKLVIPIKDLAYWDEASCSWIVEPGRVMISVGPNSADAALKTVVRVKG